MSDVAAHPKSDIAVTINTVYADEDIASSDAGPENEVGQAAQAHTAEANAFESFTRQLSSNSKRTTVDSVLDRLLTQVQHSDTATHDSSQAATSLSAERQASADAALMHSHALDRSSIAARVRSTVDLVLDAMLNQTAAQDLDTASQAGSLPSAAAASVDSLLNGVLQEAAAVVNGGRTAADSILDEVLAEAAAHDQQHRQHVTQAATDGINGHPAPTGLPESTTAQHSSQHMTEVLPQHMARDSQHGAAAAQQNSGIGNGQPRTTADQVLDAVLEQVAANASRQRTTADSVLDSVLADVSGAGMHSRGGSLQAAAGAGRAGSNGLDEAQDDGYISQVCLVGLHQMHLVHERHLPPAMPVFLLRLYNMPSHHSRAAAMGLHTVISD